MHEVALRHYLEEFDRSSKGIELELKTFDIEGSGRRSKRSYSEIFRDERILAVIDNTWGENIQAVASMLRDSEVPVIAINADRQKLDFGNNVMFLGHGDTVPRILAAFAKRVLETAPRVLVMEEDYALSQEFLDQFSALGIAPRRVIRLPSAEFVQPRWSEVESELRAALSESGDSPLVVLNTHSNWGNPIVTFIDEQLRGVTILGGPYVISSGRGRFGVNDHGNALILMTRPADTLSKRVHSDLEMFERKYPEYFASDSFNKPLFVRRCQDAVAILDNAITSSSRVEEPTEVTRRDLLDYFHSLAEGRVLVGGHDLFAFDSDLMLIKEAQFEVHRNGRTQSYLRQLNSGLRPIPNVQFGLDILDIGEVDPDHGTFHAELYYWVRLADSDSDLGETIHFRNLRAGAVHDLILERKEGGFLYRLYKVSAEFQAEYDLRDFPLDEQELVLKVELVHDTDALRVSFDSESFEASQDNSGQFRISAWEILDYYTTVDNYVSSSLLGGDPSRPDAPQKFQSLSVRLRVRRRFLGPFVTFILPLAMIGLAAVAVLQLRDVSFKNVGEVCVGIFLSIVTYSIAFAEFKPESSVLTKADMLFYATFLVVLLVFLSVIVLGSIYRPEELAEGRARRIRLAGRAIGLLYLAALIAIPLS